MQAIDKMIEKLDTMINELNKNESNNNITIYLKNSLNNIFNGLKMNAYKYKAEELQEQLKNKQ